MTHFETIQFFDGGLHPPPDGSFTSIGDLVKSIEAYLAERDLDPKRYVWKAEGEEILRKIKRAKEALTAVELEKSL